MPGQNYMSLLLSINQLTLILRHSLENQIMPDGWEMIKIWGGQFLPTVWMVVTIYGELGLLTVQELEIFISVISINRSKETMEVGLVYFPLATNPQADFLPE